jgi:uncharacterized membrane protein YfcA
MTPDIVAFLVGAGMVAGIVNALAGGGILFVLPALQVAGVAPVSAAASANVAVWPAHAIAAAAAREDLAGVRERLQRSALVAMVGAAVGALLLLWSGDRLFRALVPWLVLLATLTFAAGPAVAALVRRRIGEGHSIAAMAFEFVVAVYGGYFGAGLGVLMMAALALLGVDDVRQANTMKNALATLITSIAIAIFVAGGAVAWRETLVVLAGALAGGYLGARLAGVVPAVWLRRGVIAVGLCLTAYYFVH